MIRFLRSGKDTKRSYCTWNWLRWWGFGENRGKFMSSVYRPNAQHILWGRDGTATLRSLWAMWAQRIFHKRKACPGGHCLNSFRNRFLMRQMNRLFLALSGGKPIGRERIEFWTAPFSFWERWINACEFCSMASARKRPSVGISGGARRFECGSLEDLWCLLQRLTKQILSRSE